MKRVANLYRVSTKKQVDLVKDDIPMQRIACREFAERQGWTVVIEKEEKGISGFKVSASKRDAIDGVNVGEDEYIIETEIGSKGGSITKAKRVIQKRERLTRKQRWDSMDEDIVYTANQLDKDVVNPSQICNVIKAFKQALEEVVYPERKEVPKTLIFAKSDSHADDIIQIVRDEFGEGNEFCRKITYRIDGKRPSQNLCKPPKWCIIEAP